MEQMSIINNVEIIGVLEKLDESCKEVVELIASKLGVKLPVVNVSRAHPKLSNRPRKMYCHIIIDRKQTKYNEVC